MNFQVLQGSVETLFRWGGNHLYHFSTFIRENVYQISSKSPEFYGRYYKTHIGLSFFLDTLYSVHFYCASYMQTAGVW